MDFKLLLSLLVIQGAVLVAGREILKESRDCSQKGLNPHPDNCRKYLICTNDGFGRLIASYHTCPGSDVYSHEERTCVSYEKRQHCKVEPQKDPDCAGRHIHCEECKTLIICQKVGDKYVYLGSQDCGKDKFCDDIKLKCTTEMPPECIPHSPCTGVGVFPNIQNCSIFYECTKDPNNENALIDSTKICPKGFVFTTEDQNPTETDVLKKFCKKRSSPSDCHKVKCPGDELITKPYPGDNTYYVLCTLDGYFVFKCDVVGEEYDGHGCSKPAATTTKATATAATKANKAT